MGTMRKRCENCNCEIDFVTFRDQTPSCPSCGSRVALSGSIDETLTECRSGGFQFKHFEMLEQLGMGHFGVVWKARDTRLDRMVAVKLPNTDNVLPGQQKQFLREAQAAANLDHPNIVPVYEVGIEDPPFISSKLIEGVSMRDRIESYAGDFKRIAEVCRQIASALQHSHERGIIHRDLKPGNILIDQRGTPFVTDFGLAKREGGELTFAAEGDILGTPAYMSPEQAEGKLEQVDARSDVYALGVILYELLTGRRPFVAKTHRALFYQIVNDDPPDPKTLNQKIPVDLRNICTKALEKSRSQRYASAIEMEKDLTRFLEGAPVSAKPWPIRRRLARVLYRRRVGLTMAALVLALLSATLFAVRSPKPDWWDTALEVQLTTKPVGAKAVFMPIDPKSGMPIDGQEIELPGVSPFRTRLPAGTYRVTAWLDEQQFHEVVRTVPADESDTSRTFPHQRWEIEDDGVIELPTITLFAQSKVIDGMLEIPAGTCNREASVVGEQLECGGFWMAKKEATIGDLRRSKVPIPESTKMETIEINSQALIGYISLHEAISVREAMGWSPPSDLEYEYVIQNAIENQDPQSILPTLQDAIEEWSGPCEYVEGRYVVRTDLKTSPTGRVFMEPFYYKEKLGLRGFRPKKPRTRASDFVTVRRSQ